MALAKEAEDILLAELEELNKNVKEAGWRAAEKVVNDVRDMAVVDTGSMRDSVYRSENGGRSTYSQAVGQARGDNPRVVILPEEKPMQERNIAETLIGVAAKHGFMVENGFAPEGRRPPKPFFEPGVQNAEDHYMEELEGLNG